MIRHSFNDKFANIDSTNLPDNAVLPLSTHQNNVLVINSLEQAKSIKPRTSIADGMVTNVKNIELFITGADCPSVILKDQEMQIAGIAHCGWKPALDGILENTIAEMHKLGAKNIQAFIGPGMEQQSFECRNDLSDKFIEQDKDNAKFFKHKSDEHMLFDLKGYCKAVLEQQNISDIDVSSVDTYANPEYHSFRELTHKHGSEFATEFELNKDNYVNFNSVIIK